MSVERMFSRTLRCLSSHFSKSFLKSRGQPLLVLHRTFFGGIEFGDINWTGQRLKHTSHLPKVIDWMVIDMPIFTEPQHGSDVWVQIERSDSLG